jgi:osmotically-inducible protein OsmY
MNFDLEKRIMRWLTLPLALSLTLLPALAGKDKQPLTDDRLHDQIIMKLAGDQDVRGGGIDVDVHNGVVTLKGKVDTEKRKERAEKLVKHMKGVTGVENQLVISK